MTGSGKLYHFNLSSRQWHGPWNVDGEGVLWQAACRGTSGNWILVGISEATAQVWQLSHQAMQVSTHIRIEHV